MARINSLIWSHREGWWQAVCSSMESWKRLPYQRGADMLLVTAAERGRDAILQDFENSYQNPKGNGLLK